MSQQPRRPNQTESPSDEALNRLCELAQRRASDLSHELSHWSPPPDEDELGLRAYCKLCRRTIYVRAEGGLEGLAGSAASEQCDSTHV